MIHCRDAHDDVIEMLVSKQKAYGEKVRGNFHFFTEPIETARKVLNIGFSVSFTGPITFAQELAEVVSFVPIKSIMVETDAPFAAPMPFRGKRNQSRYVQEIVKKIAEIKNQNLESLKVELVKNAGSFFGISDHFTLS
jgi:TatD DNase family protein